MYKTEQKGRTLIEIILVLGVVGLVAGGMIRLIGVGLDRYKLSRVSQQLIDLQKSLNQRYAADDGYGNMRVATLISEKIVPSDMVQGNDLFHKFNGKVQLAPALEDLKGVKITFEDLPRQVCLEILTINWVIGEHSDLYSISVGGKTYMWPNQYKMNVANKLPVTIKDADDLCDSKSTNISWIFY